MKGDRQKKVEKNRRTIKVLGTSRQRDGNRFVRRVILRVFLVGLVSSRWVVLDYNYDG